MDEGRGDGGALDKGGKRVGDRIGWGIRGCRRTGLSIGGGSERVGEVTNLVCVTIDVWKRTPRHSYCLQCYCCFTITYALGQVLAMHGVH